MIHTELTMKAMVLAHSGDPTRIIGQGNAEKRRQKYTAARKILLGEEE